MTKLKGKTVIGLNLTVINGPCGGLISIGYVTKLS